MLQKLKNKLYERRLNLLFTKGIQDGKIMPFDDEVYRQMEHTYIGCVPMSFYIKYFKPKVPPGNCYERSLGMFYCLKDSVLVRGKTKNLEIKEDILYAGHGWVEAGEYVYDPSLLMRIDKALYYEMYQPTKVYKISMEDYLKIPENKEVYEEITHTRLEDYKPRGRKRFELLTNIPILLGIAKISHDTSYINDLNTYLDSIMYDEKEILYELDERLKEKTKRKKV